MYKVAKLSCKILGLYTVVNSITGMFTIVLMPQGTAGILKMIFPVVVQAIIGLLLWLLADTIANLMITDGDNSSASVSGKGDGQRIAFSVLGLFFIGTSIPKLISSILAVLFTPHQVQVAQPMITYRLLIKSTSQFVVGLVIFLGSNGLVGLLNTLRSAGLPKDKTE